MQNMFVVSLISSTSYVHKFQSMTSPKFGFMYINVKTPKWTLAFLELIHCLNVWEETILWI